MSVVLNFLEGGKRDLSSLGLRFFPSPVLGTTTLGFCWGGEDEDPI